MLFGVQTDTSYKYHNLSSAHVAPRVAGKGVLKEDFPQTSFSGFSLKVHHSN
jgi:hypothetical protein